MTITERELAEARAAWCMNPWVLIGGVRLAGQAGITDDY